jgi:type IV pilus assembly protein PilZ
MAERAFPRLPVHLEVRYQDGDELRRSFVTNLGAGGVFIRTSRPLPIGTEVVLEIALAGVEPVRLRGRVAWDRASGREDGMGIAFSEPLPERLTKLLTAPGA